MQIFEPEIGAKDAVYECFWQIFVENVLKMQLTLLGMEWAIF